MLGTASCSLDGLYVWKEFLHRTHRRQKRDINLRNNEHLWLPLARFYVRYVRTNHVYCMHKAQQSQAATTATAAASSYFYFLLYFIFFRFNRSLRAHTFPVYSHRFWRPHRFYFNFCISSSYNLMEKFLSLSKSRCHRCCLLDVPEQANCVPNARTTHTIHLLLRPPPSASSVWIALNRRLSTTFHSFFFFCFFCLS